MSLRMPKEAKKEARRCAWIAGMTFLAIGSILCLWAVGASLWVDHQHQQPLPEQLPLDAPPNDHEQDIRQLLENLRDQEEMFQQMHQREEAKKSHLGLEKDW